MKKGFTLVELLIVIGLLSVIALIVIAAINPLEQANRARDTRFKADGSQLLSSIERYFASHSNFPWVDPVGTVADNDSAFGFITSSDVNVGLCGDAACTTDGELIKSLELKTEFKNRDFVVKGNTADNTVKLFIGKAQGASSSVYACFVPMSKSNRDSACSAGKVYTLSASDGTRSSVAASTCSGAAWNTSWVICVPE